MSPLRMAMGVWLSLMILGRLILASDNSVSGAGAFAIFVESLLLAAVVIGVGA